MFTFEKQPGQDFKVLNLTDTHLTAQEWEEDGRQKHVLTHTVDELIKRTSPDLITISGDLTFSDFPGAERAYENTAAMLDSYQIPWAFVWGNHDNQGGAEMTDKHADILLSHKYCVFEKGDPALGCGNYTISINENGKRVYALIMMDTHDRMDYVNSDGVTMRKWGHLTKAQLEWYKEQVHILGNIKTTLIMHIPLYTYRDAFFAAWNDEYDPSTIDCAQSCDAKYWNEGYQESYGVMYEGVGSYPADNGEFDFIKNLGSTELVLCGHEHINNYVIDYQGVTLAYSLKTGAGCYNNDALNGGTLLHISSEGCRPEHVFVDIGDNT